MSGFSELIKNFSKTRDYVWDFFIYGCKVRSDFKRKSIRTYDDEKRRVESWMGDHMRYDDSVKGRHVSIFADSGHIHENPLYNAYYSKSFTDNDIKLHFFILDILSEGESLTLKEITDILTSSYGQFFDDQTVRNKLKEYTEEGIIVPEKQGKTMYYRITENDLDEIINRCKGLDDALKFFSEVNDFGIIGNSILKSADLKNDLFFIKHNYMIHTLEDVIIPDILSAIDEKRCISFTRFTDKKKTEMKEADEKSRIIPMQILSSVQTGRRYLAAYLPVSHKFASFRLDRINQIKKGDIFSDYDDIKNLYQKQIKRCFGVSFGMRDESVTALPLKITLTLDEEKEHFILERIEREKRCCKLEKEAEGLYTLTADVSDPNEVMHWAKTFIGRIVRIEGGTNSIRSRFFDDIKRMNNMYEEDADEHIQ